MDAAESPSAPARLISRPRCGACGELSTEGRPLRRGRCGACYEEWCKARPIGMGALCSGCGDRRKLHLRYYEIESKERVSGGRWIVLCHNCTAVAQMMKPQPRSIEGLKMRLQRDRRWGDRRAASVGRKGDRETGVERRDNDRRLGLRDLYDATDLAEELIIEMEADYEDPSLEMARSPEDMTGIHYRPSLEEITKITYMPQLVKPPEGAPDPDSVLDASPDVEIVVEKSGEVDGDGQPVEPQAQAHAPGSIAEAIAEVVDDLEHLEVAQ